jgi:uncharacterized protein YjbI with pentapeptide repeats
MPGAVVAEQPETQVAEAEQGCPVLMYNGQRCDRPIYRAPAGVDKEPVCLMHSHDPEKDDAAFQAEFERILRDAGEGVADFTRFVFPTANYRGREFRATCIFHHTTFTQDAHFAQATFVDSADFGFAAFKQDAHFDSATFARDAVFTRVTLTRRASFRKTAFTQGADFTAATFTQDADFREAKFTHGANFSGATFERVAAFNEATFERAALFSNTTFTGEASFILASFEGHAHFSGTRFEKAAHFRGATFAQGVNFWTTTFTGAALFSAATFKERAIFRETVFREDASGEPGPIFSLARFEKPELVLFYKTCLAQALFHNCDVSKFVFSAVRWRQRPNGKRMVLEEDEKLDLTPYVTEAVRTKEGDPDERSYGLIAELYQQLKKNYDDRKDYWTAGDFHYGEMEMKRLATPHANRLSQWIAGTVQSCLAKEKPGFLARWAKTKGYSERSFHVLRRELHRRMGLAAWYKYASEYGESYGRPVLWLVGVLILFTLLFPIWGLRPGGKSSSPQPAASESRAAAKEHTPELSYANLSRYRSAEPGGARVTAWSLFGHSAMTTLGVAAFQRDLAYEPSYPWGRLLAIFEILLTSTLLALFLLAVRRQFRR